MDLQRLKWTYNGLNGPTTAYLWRDVFGPGSYADTSAAALAESIVMQQYSYIILSFY